MATIIKFSRIKARPGRSGAKTSAANLARPKIPWPLVALIVIAGCLFFHASRPTEVIEANARFTSCEGSGSPNCVIDGDTIRLGGEKIRLIGLDAPEIFSSGCTRERAIGIMAKQELLYLVNEGPFQLNRYRDDDRDKYGRKLRALERNGESLADRLIAKGLATRGPSDSSAWCSSNG